MTPIKNVLADFYLEFLNNWLTIERYAEFNDMSINDCQMLINMGRVCHNERAGY